MTKEIALIIYLLLGVITAFAFIGELAFSYVKDCERVQSSDQDIESIEAPDLFVMTFMSLFICFLWPSAWYLIARTKFRSKDNTHV